MPAFNPGTKACSACQEIKPFSDFSANKAKHDGLQHKCKACFKARAAKSRNPEWANWREIFGYIPQEQPGDTETSPGSVLRARAMAKFLGVPMHTEWAKVKPQWREFLGTLTDEEYKEMEVRLGFPQSMIGGPRLTPYIGDE